MGQYSIKPIFAILTHYCSTKDTVETPYPRIWSFQRWAKNKKHPSSPSKKIFFQKNFFASSLQQSQGHFALRAHFLIAKMCTTLKIAQIFSKPQNPAQIQKFQSLRSFQYFIQSSGVGQIISESSCAIPSDDYRHNKLFIHNINSIFYSITSIETILE